MRRQKSSNPIRRANQLKDEVYREMYLLESSRPGSEMGLALALLHAWTETDSLPQEDEVRIWLRQICPLCLRLIEDSMDKAGACWPVIQ